MTKKKTIFQEIKSWHNKAKIQVNKENSLIDLAKQLELIQEEYTETFNAWKDYSYHKLMYEKLGDKQYLTQANEYKKELLDGLGDTIWVLTGMILRLGVNPDEVMNIILDSNNSKFLKLDNPDYKSICKETIENYRLAGIEVYSQDIDGYTVFYDKVTNKVKKPVSFIQPNFDKLV
jgi:predicted HAD superfamily Cof-like phosphohydrolase